MSESIDLEAYFARIGYDGPRETTLDTLRRLHALHPAAISFENLDSLMKRPVKLDLASIQAKLVNGRRGGYCYEQNGLFRAVLETLGFSVTGLGARVQWMAPEGFVPPRTHMLLRVDVPEGPHIADVGFGGLTLTAPLRLEPELEQPTPHGTFRLATKEDGELQLQALLREGWTRLYQFSLTPQAQADYELGNWWVSTHPLSPFVNGLMLARVAGERRLGFRNNQLTVHHPDGRSERRCLNSDELAAVLAEQFELPRSVHGGALDPVFERLCAEPAAGSGAKPT